jgi:exosortase/archaeosortase family protein
MSHTKRLVALQLLGFWSVWRWYVSHLFDSADQLWGLLALATAILFLIRERPGPGLTINRLITPALLIFLYAATFPLLPPLARAVIALTAVGVTFSLIRFGTIFHPGVLGLLYLSLPLMPSLQFYGGYPLRILVAAVTAPILRLAGFAVVQQGACLDWAGHQIWIDAPCSGIRMLWVGLYFGSTLICIFRLRFWQSLAVMAFAIPTIIIGNIFRAVALFYIEAGVFIMPDWTHDYAGVVAFGLVAIGLVSAVHFVRRKEVCREQLFT